MYRVMDPVVPIEGLTFPDIEVLLSDSVAEAAVIDYKRTFPDLSSDAARAELLADVSSFANSRGGTLVYGIAAKNGVPSTLAPFLVPNKEALLLRAKDVIRNGTKPPIRAIDLVTIDAGTESFIILRIGRSLSSPHMVNIQSRANYHGKYFGRSAAGKHLLDVSELRELFLLSQTAADRVRSFRIDRLGKVLSADTPVHLDPKSALVVLHLVPIDAFALSRSVDLSAVFNPNANPDWQRTLFYSHAERRFNLDGFVTFLSDDSYTQFFRNGAIESVGTIPADMTTFQNTPHRLLPIDFIEARVVGSIQAFLLVLKAIGASPPVALMLSLHGLNGWAIGTNPMQPFLGLKVDRDDLLLPDSLIEQFSTDVPILLKPTFDALWNAAGYRSSKNYDAQGRWTLHPQ